MSERLSDEELEHLEAWARVNSYGGGRQKLSVLALVGEVRRLRVDNETLRRHMVAQPSNIVVTEDGRAIPLAPQEPAPLDTGRWVQGATVPEHWEIPGANAYLDASCGRIATEFGHAPHLTADDLEAAARIIRHHEEKHAG